MVTEAGSPLLVMDGIVKRYGATVALNGVDFEAQAGEIHALLGENGAGKSTLMHVLSGLTRPDAGRIRLEGRPVSLPSPRAARALGIAMVHQHFTLVPAFTVAENLALDTPPPARGAGLHYAPRQAAARALERAAVLGWRLDPEAIVGELSVGVQQRVEIVKALATDARLLIFDEPTAVLSGAEVAELFAVLRHLRDEGRAVILITHKLAEILAVADRVTVLRRGHKVASCPVAETDAPQLAFWMVGDAPAVPEGKESGVPQPDRGRRTAACTASDLIVLGDRGEQAVRGVSLAVRRGEIFGIGGVDGNGQTELAEALAGLRSLQAGTIAWEGGPFLPGQSPRTGYIPQDRRRVGLALPMTVEDNLILEAVRQREYRRGPFLRRRRLRGLAASLIRRFDIRTPSPTLPAAALSGGNQQKIVVARALHGEPEWIVAVNPTRGLDIAATRFVHTQLLQARARGAAIVLISTDLDELAALSDRASILSGGHLSDYSLGQPDQTELGLLLGGLGQAE
ncbi:MAG TPA: ABC transporter ATP-binding protein [Chthonomonadaceae bacterium]|nr:ABC transporter ATP-binding protein [Chthonomonadaceae bacterium]